MGEINVDEALASLEVLMSEFFTPTTGNVRKREIEIVLENFINQRDAWKHCLYFTQKTSNQYVQMFSLTTIENLINKRWMSLPGQDKSELRRCLWLYLTNTHHSMPNFLRNKLAKLMVDIARYDWPHFYPDFFTNIIELLNGGGNSTLLGLILARSMSEELGSPRDNGAAIPTGRLSELQRHLLKGIPQLLQTLSSILDKYSKTKGDKEHNNPPPSPTNHCEDMCPASTPNFLPDLLASSNKIASSRETETEIILLCLNTLQHLFSWLPLSSHVPPSLVTTVFNWASTATQTEYGEAVSMAGLCGVCELLYRRYAPPSSGATALRLQHGTLRLLRHLTNHTHTRDAELHKVSAEYLDKLAEFLRLFVSLHFRRLEAEQEFDAIEFLSHLFQYTFQVPMCSTFINCLDIWTQFIDILKPQDSLKYSDALMALVNGILNKIQFVHNRVQLQQLDNDIIDDDGETEWQSFLRHCIECIAKVAELTPLHIFTLVVERWQCLVGVYARASARVGSSAPGGNGGPEGDRLLATLLDLASITRAIGRLAPTLFEECTDASEVNIVAGGVCERLIAALSSAQRTRPHRANTAPISGAMVAVHAEMLACVGAWACYMWCGSEGISSVVDGGQTTSVPDLFGAITPLLMPQDIPEPPLLCHAAACLLLSLSTSLKPHNPSPLPYISDLYAQAQVSLQHLEPKTVCVVRQALCSLLVRRGAAGAAEGGPALGSLLAAWGAPLLAPGLPGRAAGSPLPAAAADCLPALADLLSHFTDHPLHAKKALAAAVERQVEVVLNLVSSGTCSSKVTAQALTLFLALFRTLQQQLGREFTDLAISVFIEVARREQPEEAGEGLRALGCLVRAGVEGGALRGGDAVSAAVSLALQHALPVAQANQDVDAQMAWYELLASILIHRWRHFFPSGIRGTFSQIDQEDGPESKATMNQFLSILRAIGASLMKSDINIFRLNLETLEKLNTKWKLYHKAVFRVELLAQFLTVLLQALMSRQLCLLQDEILVATYAMANVDFGAFFGSFLRHFLSNLEGITDQQAATLMDFSYETDYPTFVQNILKIVNDVHCYRICNACIDEQPIGSNSVI